MEIKDLRSFVAVYEAGGFARAAEAMNATQSGVSARIRKLEDYLGSPLFQRLHRSIVPTAKGERMYRYAKEVIAVADRAVKAMREDEAA